MQHPFRFKLLPQQSISTLNTVWVVLAIFGCWLWANPYQGIWHDARIYLVLALQNLNPEAFKHDVWFMFGSQGGASLFDEFYTALLMCLSVEHAALLLSLLGGGLWIISVLALANQLVGKGYIGVGLLIAVTPLAYTYDQSDVFLLNESFATARPFAMAFTLFSLYFFLKQRCITALCFVIVALICHPLMAIWALAILLVLILSDKQILMVSITSLIMLLALVTLYTPAWLQPVEPLWYQLVANTSSIVFIPDVAAIRLDANLWYLAILLLAAKYSTEAPQRSYLAVALVCSWAWLVALIVNFYYPAELLAKAQLWRALWLAATISVIAFAWLWITLKSARYRVWLRLLLLLSFFIAGYGGGLLLLIVWVMLSIPSVNKQVPTLLLHLQTSSTTFRTMLKLLLLLALICVMVLYFYPILYSQILLAPSNPLLAITVPIAGVILLLYTLFYLPAKYKGIGVITGFALALLCWDQRTTVAQETEKQYGTAQHPVAKVIQPGELVYWPNTPTGPWFFLGTAAYASSIQGIGIIFSKEHAYMHYERLQRIQQLTGSAISIELTNPRNLHDPAYLPASLSAEAAQSLCQDEELDVIILDQQYLTLHPIKVISPYNEKVVWYVYRCAILKKQNNNIN